MDSQVEEYYIPSYVKHTLRFKKKKLDPVLEDLVKHAEFHLKILHEFEDLGLFKIGSFKFTVHPSKDSVPPKIPLTNTLSFYVGKRPDKCFIYYEENAKSPKVVHYSPVSCSVPYEILTGLRSFSLSIIQNDERKSSKDEPLEFCVSVQIGKELVKTQDLSEPFKIKDSFFKTLLHFNKNVFDNRYPFGEEVTWALYNTETLYNEIRRTRKQFASGLENIPWLNLEPLRTDSLKVDLRPYQIRAVKWMLQRESDIDFFEGHPLHDLPYSGHPLYAKLRTLDGQCIFVNKYTGQVYLNGLPKRKHSKPGGILADEMGLGKSIEVLALVLLNPRPSITSNYKFPSKDTSETSDYVFECVCGSREYEELEDDAMEALQCCKCGIWQHSSCLSFEKRKIPIDYLCPYCWLDPAMPPYPSKATLIVTPSSISHQWIEEIEKHLVKDSLTWLFYDGIKGNKYIQPYTLASYDVVLTTYEIFRKEINYVNLPFHSKKEGERKLRHPKKFITAPSPLLAVEWWRVCFDEAQMVESQPSTVSQFASKIHRVNLWCVTGTPIQQSVKEVFGLLKLLGVDPYEHEKWFKILLYEPYWRGYPEPLIGALQPCFWRTAKKDILDEICIPSQNEVLHYLDFSAVEEYFYARQHEKCAQQTTLTLSKFPNKNLQLKNLDRHTLATVIAPLLQLRQACCHPQAVSTGRGLYLPLKKKTMTMEGLLNKLLKKCKLECEEHHRQLIAATNGLAGIYQILGDVKRSVDLYREVLQLEKEHSGVIKTDRVQIIHALLNLADVLERHIKTKPRNADPNVHCDNKMQTDDENSRENFEENPYNIGRTVEDDKLRERAEELRSKYLNKHQDLIKGAVDGLDVSKNHINKVLSEVHTGEVSAWCFGVLTKVKQLKQDDMVIFKVKEFLNDKQVMDSKLDKTFFSILTLKYILTREIDKLEQSRLALRDAIIGLSPQPSFEEINEAIDCHLRPSGMSGKCKYCEVHELFNAYEANLYRFKKDTQAEEPMTSEEALMAEQRRGIWADSEIEMILKAILGIAKTLNCDTELIEDGAAHLKLLENYKKEFKLMRSVWVNIRDYVSAIDEVEMAKIRMRVRNPGEAVSDPPVPYILESSQVLTMSIQLQSDKMNALSSLKRKKGRLLYLQNLVKSQDDDNKAVVNKECPICVKEMGTKWAVLLCGHVLCNDCVRVLVMMSTRNRPILPNVKCPVCRQNSTHEEICYVNTDSKCDLPDSIEVKGSYSTKIVAIVKCILLLLKEDPKPKILVFSSWPKVLSILVEALKANSVPHLRIADRAKFEKSVKLFKIDPEKNVLLLPIQSGANGLNLIEATHVLLVEPLLNAGVEKQALGRVHRLGQTKETTFHRFIVKSTIEEKIYDVVKTSCSSSSSNPKNDDKEMTLKELADLFSNSNSEPMDIQ